MAIGIRGRGVRVMALCSLLWACTSEEVPPTQLIVTVRQGDNDSTQLKRVVVTIYARDNDETLDSASSRHFLITDDARSPRANEVALPFSFGVLRKSTSHVLIQLDGYDDLKVGAQPVVEQKAIVRFQARRALTVDFVLEDVCVGSEHFCASLDETCHGLNLDPDNPGHCGSVPTLEGTVKKPGTEIDALPEPSDGGFVFVIGDADVAPVEPDADAADAGVSELSGDPIELGVPMCATPRGCDPAYPCVPSASLGFSCLGQFAEWHMPGDTAHGAKYGAEYEANNEAQVVTDKITNLVWQQYPPIVYPGCTGSVAVPGDSCTRDEAARYCSTVTLGDGNARLPSKIELESLIDDSVQDPALDRAAFYVTGKGKYWTRSPYANDPDEGWAVDVSTGRSDKRNLLEKGLVRCVRSLLRPSGTPDDRYRVDIATKQVTDTRTTLSWQQQDSCHIDGFTQAQTVCSAAGSGFRVPTRKELLTLVDPTRYAPAIDPHFTSTDDEGWLWTATPDLEHPGTYWLLGAKRGDGLSERLLPKDDAPSLCVRCVR